MIHFPHPLARERRRVIAALPAGWSLSEPFRDPALGWVVCARAQGFPFAMRGGHGRTLAAAYRVLGDKLHRRRLLTHSSRFAAFALAVSTALLGVTMALPALTVAETPSPTPISSSPTPEPSWDSLAPTYPVPTLLVYVTPAPTSAPKFGASAAGTCPAPNMAHRNAGNSSGAQAYLRSRVSRKEYDCAWWLVMQESSWRANAQNPNYIDAACGLPQANPCSKMARWIAARHPGQPTYLGADHTTVYAIDWRAYPNDQIDWLIAYVHGKYGSFWQAAAFKFGYWDASGAWHRGKGWY